MAASDPPLRLAYLADPNSIHTRTWLGFFAGRGHEVHLLVEEGRDVAPGLDAAIVVDRFPSYGVRFRPRGAWRARQSLRRLLGRIRPDVLHSHYVTRYGWLGWLSGFRPLVTTVWGSDVFLTVKESPTARLLARLVLRRSALVTAVSLDLARAGIAAGARRDRVRIAQFGIDPAAFSPGPAPAALRTRLDLDGCRVLLAPRAAAPVYRQDVVVAALEQLPEDVAAVFSEHAANAETLATLRGEVERRGLRERVRWVGTIAREEMPDAYRLADVVVSVPSSDAFPVTLLEAMACGRPVVASDLPSSREGLKGFEEWLVPVGDAGATAAAIRRAIDLPAAEREALGARLREAAIARGDRERSLGAIEAEYRRLAGERAR